MNNHHLNTVYCSVPYKWWLYEFLFSGSFFRLSVQGDKARSLYYIYREATFSPQNRKCLRTSDHLLLSLSQTIGGVIYSLQFGNMEQCQLIVVSRGREEMKLLARIISGRINQQFLHLLNNNTLDIFFFLNIIKIIKVNVLVFIYTSTPHLINVILHSNYLTVLGQYYI